MSDDLRDLIEWFSRPDRYKAIDPRRAVWLTYDNIEALSRDEKFMAGFRQRREPRGTGDSDGR